MAALIVTQGLLSLGQNFSHSTNFNSARFIQCMMVDDGTALLAANTKSNDSAANEFDQAFTATPTETAPAKITHSTVIPTGSANSFVIKRVLLHNDTAANVTLSSTTLVGGIDGQSYQKTLDATLTPTLDLIYTSVP